MYSCDFVVHLGVCLLVLSTLTWLSIGSLGSYLMGTMMWWAKVHLRSSFVNLEYRRVSTDLLAWLEHMIWTGASNIALQHHSVTTGRYV